MRFAWCVMCLSSCPEMKTNQFSRPCTTYSSSPLVIGMRTTDTWPNSLQTRPMMHTNWSADL
jgi:hypothetical protein